MDEFGFGLHCCAIGRNARNSYLVNGNEVVLYFCAARGGLNKSTGSLWLYKRSCIVYIGKKVAQKREAVTLLDADARQ